MNDWNRDTHIEKIEEIAAFILETKQIARPRRPIVLEFCGTPKSGKTSCLSSLNLFLKRNGFSTRLLTERAGVCPITDKFNPLFNIWTSNSAIAELSAAFAEHGNNLDVIICDRGIYDALCWFEWLLEHDHLKLKDYEALTQYITTDRLRSMIDLVYVFKARPEVAMKREYAHLLTNRHGSIMNTDVLREFNQSIENAEHKYRTAFRCVKTIDTSDLDQNEVSYQVTETVLQTLNDLLVERIGYFKRSDLSQYEDKQYWYFSDFNSIPKLNYMFRNNVEDDPKLVQPVPIVVLTDAERKHVLVAKKRTRSISTNSPEKGKLLAYFGGHIRTEDNLHGDNESILSIASTTLSREIQEELSVSLSITDSDPLCIWLKGNKRSQAHLAIVYLYEADFEHLAHKLDRFEFIQSTGKSKSGKLLPIADLDAKEMEGWSRIILREKVFAGWDNQLLFGHEV